MSPRGTAAIVRSGEQIARIVEERDASPGEREIREINSGIYAFALDGLFEALRGIASENAQREYYLPDIVALYRKRGLGVETFDGGGRRRDPGNQQPPRAGGSEPNRETEQRTRR